MVHKYSRDYYLKTQQDTIEKSRLWRKNNPEKVKEGRKKSYQKSKPLRQLAKVDVLTHYGKGKLACIKCGFSDIRSLTLDHIIPIGRKKRRVTGIAFYQILQRQGYPEGFQTLCANCQMIKMFEGNEWKLN